MNICQLRLPSNYLASDPNAIKDTLAEYLQIPLEIELKMEDEHWIATLAWPDDPSTYIDPYLTKELGEWQANLTLRRMSCFHRLREVNSRPYLTALFHSWGVYLWSLWLHRLQKYNRFPSGFSKIYVLHVDAHDDLMRSNIGIGKEHSIVNSLTGQPVYLDQPESVKVAVETGAINIGNFATLFFYYNIPVYYLHLYNHSFKPAYPETTFRVRPKREKTDTVYPSFLNLSVELIPTKWKHLSAPESRYVSSFSLEYLLSLITDDSPIFLDIDLDFFNNRYNWDTEWRSKNYPDPNIVSTFDKISEFFTNPTLVSHSHQIHAINIAFSPSFFPSEYWKVIDPALDLHISRLISS